MRGDRLAAQQKGRRPVVAPATPRAGGRPGQVLDGAAPPEPACEDAWDLALLSLRDVRRVVNLLADELAFQPQPIAITVQEAARATSLSRSLIWRAISSGDLEARKVGRRVVVETEALRAWLRRFPLAGRGERGGNSRDRWQPVPR